MGGHPTIAGGEFIICHQSFETGLPCGGQGVWLNREEREISRHYKKHHNGQRVPYNRCAVITEAAAAALVPAEKLNKAKEKNDARVERLSSRAPRYPSWMPNGGNQAWQAATAAGQVPFAALTFGAAAREKLVFGPPNEIDHLGLYVPLPPEFPSGNWNVDPDFVPFFLDYYDESFPADTSDESSDDERAVTTKHVPEIKGVSAEVSTEFAENTGAENAELDTFTAEEGGDEDDNSMATDKKRARTISSSNGDGESQKCATKRRRGNGQN
jgi:hypothetical protein